MASELLSPAGDFQTALAAFDAGADAVYCGLHNFSARRFAQNFSFDELRQLMRVAQARGKKVYVTVNTLVEEAEVESICEQLAVLEDIHPDALIVQDLGIARLCRLYFPGLTLHASTQLVAHNLEGVTALGKLGFTRVVLARELSLDEIAFIAQRCGKIELECFIHGALCYSVSGLCLFSAMEKGRSGNRGACAYCCRQAQTDSQGHQTFPFSMKDLRLGEDVCKLASLGVASLKIEGRMKSALYVASVTAYYRQILDGSVDAAQKVTEADLETVFSRRTTELYFNGAQKPDAPIDPTSLGHIGTPIGILKRITKDREGRSWLRFHTSRALEKHDGLQFASSDGGKPFGLGIQAMRTALSRRLVCEVPANSDVEIEWPEETDKREMPRPGATIYCSMSNAVKRRFQSRPYRPEDYLGTQAVSAICEITPTGVSLKTSDGAISASIEVALTPARSPEKTVTAVTTALMRLGGTDYTLSDLKIIDDLHLFVPPALLNELRRQFVTALDAARAEVSRQHLAAALNDAPEANVTFVVPEKSLRIRVGQTIPTPTAWDEVVVAITTETTEADLPHVDGLNLRLALPVWTREEGMRALRLAVKRLIHAGFLKWEVADLATLQLVQSCGIDDITADWTLYVANVSACAALTDLGVRRFVASPENLDANHRALAESGFTVAFLKQQTTPLFMSPTEPAGRPSADSRYEVQKLGELWVTADRCPRHFNVPVGAPTRVDLSWDLS